MQFVCPLPAALKTITPVVCPFRMDQIVKLILFRKNGGPTFASTTALQTLATWTPLLAATGSTKVITTPIFSGFVVPQSEALTTGGNDNSTFNGIREYNGEGAVTATGQFKNMPSQPYEDMQALTPESLASAVGKSNLLAMFVNKDGVIFYKTDMTSGTAVITGANLYNYRVGSRGSEGFNNPDIHPFGFDLQPNWDFGWSSIVPSFDPLTQLVNPATT